jgi:hypothetical protein
VQLGRLAPAIPRRDTKNDVFAVGCVLGTFNDYVPVRIVVKAASVNQIVLSVETSAAGILLDEIFVRESALGVFVLEFGI